MADSIIDKLKEILTGEPEREREPDIRPASEDPLGDPADSEAEREIPRYGHRDYTPAGYSSPDIDTDREQGIRPASEDPLGDPADQQEGVLPASQDPLGDPADDRRYR